MSVQLDVYKEWLGIPEGPRPPDHYQLLRLVQFEDAPEKVRNNYKKLNAHVRKYATGKYSLESQELLNELAKAMLCLTDAERKADYDRSLGRVTEADYGPSGRKPMDVVLFEQNLITQQQLAEAREFSQKSGLEMRDALVQLKMVDQAVAAEALAQELGLPYMDLTDMIPDDSILDRTPKKLVKQHSFLPLFIDNDVLLIATAQEPTHDLIDELRLRFDCPVRPVLATPLAINQGIAKYYAPGARQEIDVDIKKSGKKSSSSKSTARAANKPISAMSSDEQHQHKMMGMIIFCWAAIGSVLLDQLVIPARWGIPYVLPIVVVPIAGVLVWLKYFKR